MMHIRVPGSEADTRLGLSLTEVERQPGDKKEDFRLRPDSRVFRIVAGFAPIPVERIGRRTAEKRDADRGVWE